MRLMKAVRWLVPGEEGKGIVRLHFLYIYIGSNTASDMADGDKRTAKFPPRFDQLRPIALYSHFPRNAVGGCGRVPLSRDGKIPFQYFTAYALSLVAVARRVVNTGGRGDYDSRGVSWRQRNDVWTPLPIRCLSVG